MDFYLDRVFFGLSGDGFPFGHGTKRGRTFIWGGLFVLLFSYLYYCYYCYGYCYFLPSVISDDTFYVWCSFCSIVTHLLQHACCIFIHAKAPFPADFASPPLFPYHPAPPLGAPSLTFGDSEGIGFTPKDRGYPEFHHINDLLPYSW